MAWLQIQIPAAMWNHLSVLILPFLLPVLRPRLNAKLSLQWLSLVFFLFTFLNSAETLCCKDRVWLSASCWFYFHKTLLEHPKNVFLKFRLHKLNTWMRSADNKYAWNQMLIPFFSAGIWSFKLIPEKKIHTPQATLSTSTLSEINGIQVLNSLLGSHQNHSCSQSVHTVVGKTAKRVPK